MLKLPRCGNPLCVVVPATDTDPGPNRLPEKARSPLIVLAAELLSVPLIVALPLSLSAPAIVIVPCSVRFGTLSATAESPVKEPSTSNVPVLFTVAPEVSSATPVKSTVPAPLIVVPVFSFRLEPICNTAPDAAEYVPESVAVLLEAPAVPKLNVPLPTLTDPAFCANTLIDALPALVGPV